MHPILEIVKKVIEQHATQYKLEIERAEPNYLDVRAYYIGGSLPIRISVVPINAILLRVRLTNSISQVSSELYKCVREFFDDLQKKSGMFIIYDPSECTFAAAIKDLGVLRNSLSGLADLADELDYALDEFLEFFRKHGVDITTFLRNNDL